MLGWSEESIAKQECCSTREKHQQSKHNDRVILISPYTIDRVCAQFHVLRWFDQDERFRTLTPVSLVPPLEHIPARSSSGFVIWLEPQGFGCESGTYADQFSDTAMRNDLTTDLELRLS